LTAETFYQAIVSADRFRGESSLRTWLFGIARNLYLSYLRRDGRGYAALEEALPVPGGGNPVARILESERQQQVAAALQTLSETDRSILLLYAREGLSYREIAQVLSLTLSAVKVRLYRARRRLIQALETVEAGGRDGL
jgi:RNA polymerase sigma-70 factor (ECF subfamily)